MDQINYMVGDVKYIEKPDHLIISAPHLHRVPQSKIPEFVQKLDSLAGMKIESSPLPPGVPYDCVEVLAKASMAGKPFEYIATTRPDGTLLGGIIEEYGLPIEIVEIYMGFKPLLVQDTRPIMNTDHLAESIILAIETGMKRYPNSDRTRALTNHNKIMKNLVLPKKITIQDIINFCNYYLLYHGQIIEYEFMQPDILDFRRRIEGRIGVLVGDFHAKSIDGMLEGNLMEKPIAWEEYKTFLPHSIQKTISLIEQLVLTND